jgi:phosphoribosylamine--glycine ligase
MARMTSDLGALLAGAARGELPAEAATWDPRTAVCVVVAAAGYPDAPRSGDVIEGLDAIVGAPAGVVAVFHAGTRREGGALVSAGGRVLGVTALGADLEDARRRAYGAIEGIRLDGMQFRRDIGLRRR